MIQVEFIYNNNVTVLEADSHSPFQYVIDKYIQRSLLDINSIYFIYSGEIIDPNQPIINKIKYMHMQNNKIQILVQPRNGIQIYNNSNNYYNQNNYPSYSSLTGTNESSINDTPYTSSYSNNNSSNTSYNTSSNTSYNNSYNNSSNTSYNNNSNTSYNTSSNTSYNNKLNEFTIIYKIQKKNKKFHIFDSYFVKNNKNRCYLLLNGNKIDLCEDLPLNDSLKMKDTLEIRLIEVEPITDMSDIFRHVNALLSLPDISNLNTTKVTKMRFLFDHCLSLAYLPAVLNWDTSNVTEMFGIFDN